MDDKLIILLRDLDSETEKEGCKMLAEVEVKGEYLDDDEIRTAFATFSAKARQVLPLPPNRKFDIHIGFWGVQTDFKIPKKFMEFAVANNLEVEFCLND